MDISKIDITCKDGTKFTLTSKGFEQKNESKSDSKRIRLIEVGGGKGSKKTMING